MAMPSAYITDSISPRPREVVDLSPTMIDDRIGTIGSTHGVNASPRPSSRNSGTITSSLPLLREASIFPISASPEAAETAGVAAAGDAGAADCADADGPAPAVPVAAAGGSCAVDSIGG